MGAHDKAVSLPTGQHDVAVEQGSQEPASAAQSEPSIKAQEEQEKFGSVSDHAETSKPLDGQAVAESATRPAAPAVPVVPVLPKQGPKPSTSDSPVTTEDAAKSDDQEAVAAASAEPHANGTNDPPSPVARAAPTSWANLFAKTSARASVNGSGLNGSDAANGDSAAGANNFPGSAFSKSNASSLAEAIQSYRVENNDKIDFLEPRGLINTGNMCYMNSVSLFGNLI